MALPVLKLNLAPPPTLWRQYHVLIAWAMLLVGALSLGGILVATVLAYRQAALAGQKVVDLTARRQSTASKQAAIKTKLESIDVEKELPRWRLAERILSERGVPWSRLSAELERSLVQDVRLKSIQRTRNSSQKVELKIKGEARNRQAEDAFIESLQKNEFFTQVILEREAETQGGGLEFDCVLPSSTQPPPYVALPKYGPSRAANAAPPAPTPQPPPQRTPQRTNTPRPGPSAPPPASRMMPAPQRTVQVPTPQPAPEGMQPVPPPMQPHPGPPPNYRHGRPNQGTPVEEGRQ